jgi:hypothetical protein
MSKRRIAPRRPADPRPFPTDESEAIALRVHQLAAAAGVMAESQEPPLSHAIYLLEASLLDVEQRLEGLRATGR